VEEKRVYNAIPVEVAGLRGIQLSILGDVYSLDIRYGVRSHAISDILYLKVLVCHYSLEVKMTNENHRHLINKLAEVPDKRNPVENDIRYRLS